MFELFGIVCRRGFWVGRVLGFVIILMGDFDELCNSIRKLFLEVFSINCKLEDSEMTEEEQQAIISIDIFEILENFKEVVMSLIAFKQEFISTDKAELVNRSEKFETLLQKLEAEVRSHISLEHQLKLHIETNQSISEDLEQQNSKHQSEIKSLQERLKKFQSSKREKDLLEKIQNLEDSLKAKELIIKKLENELIDFKNFGLKCDSEKLIKKKLKGKEEAFEQIKQKIEGKSVGLHKIQKLILGEGKSCRERSKGVRKSFNDGEAAKSRVYELKITKIPARTHSRSTSDNIRPRSVGRRTPSR